MFLIFDAPGWRAARRGDHVIVQRGEVGPRVVAGALQPSATDGRAVFDASAPPGTTTHYLEFVENLVTRDGWPMKLATFEIRRGDAVLGTRLGAIYAMAYFTGLAIGVLTTPEDREALVAVLATARPDLRPPEITAIADLWAEPTPDVTS